MEKRFGPPTRTPLEVRFWRYVHKTEGCWLWTGAPNRTGYGTIRRSGRGSALLLAHRASWELHNGPIPEGLAVCHECDTPPCVRPEHLFLGTIADNNADMMGKGRYGVRPEHLPRGRAHPNAKLTAEAVRDIRRLYAEGTGLRALSRQFAVSTGTLSSVIRRATWAHVE